MFRKKQLSVRTQLSVDARILKTCLSKLCQPNQYQIRIKGAILESTDSNLKLTDSIMTLNCELCQSESLILSGRLFIKLSKICFLCTYVHQMIIQQGFNVLLQLQFYNVFTNGLSTISKCFHWHFLVFELLPLFTLLKMCARGQRTFLVLNF